MCIVSVSKKFHVPWELCKQCKMFLLYKRRKKSAFPCSIGKHLDNLHVCWNKGTTTEQSSHEGSLQPRRNTAHISNTLVYVASVQSGESSTLILTLTATSVRKGVPAPRRQNRKAPTRFPPRRRTALLGGQRLPASVQPPVPQATGGQMKAARRVAQTPYQVHHLDSQQAHSWIKRKYYVNKKKNASLIAHKNWRNRSDCCMLQVFLHCYHTYLSQLNWSEDFFMASFF